MTKEEEPKSYITASIESNLHKAISAEAKRNDQSFSKQVQEYRDQVIELDEKLGDARIEIHNLREEIKKITDVN